MRAALPLFVLLLAIGAAAIAWTTFEPDTAAPERDPAPSDVPKPASSQSASASSSSSSSSDVSELHAQRSEATSAATGPSGASEFAPNGVWLQICIVDTQTQQPIANANVRWDNSVHFERLKKLPPRQRPQSRRETDKLLVEMAEQAKADGAGMVRVALGKANVQVTAWSEGRFGSQWFRLEPDDPERGHVLAIDRDVTVRALVLDADGEPANGVPVVLHRSAAKGTDYRSWIQPEATDRGGIAAFEHVQKRPGWRADAAASGARSPWRLEVATPGMRGIYAPVDPDAITDDPQTLQLPPTGGMSVQVLSAGAPVRDPLRVNLHAKPGSRETVAASAMRQWPKLLDAEGLVNYPHLPLARTFLFGTHQWQIEVSGPDLPNQSVRRTIELNQHLVTLSGRLINERGEGIPGRHGLLHVDLERTRGERTERDTDWAAVETDAEGRFACRLAPLASNEQLTGRNIRLQLTSSDNNTQELAIADRELFLGHNELGDLTLVAAPLICACRLNYQHPAPATAFVSIERLERGVDGRDSWQVPAGDHSLMTRERAFELRGKVDPGRYRLRIAAVGHIPCEPLEFEVGATDLVIDVASGSRFQATCKLPVGLPAEAIRVELVPRESGQPSEQGIAKDQATGTVQFHWKALRSGSYSLRIRPWGWQRTVYEQDGIVVAEDASSQELGILDLTGRVACLNIQPNLPMLGESIRTETAYAFVLPQSGELLQATRITKETSAIAIPTTASTLMIGGEALILQERVPAQNPMAIAPQLRPRTELSFDSLQIPAGYVIFARVEPLTKAAPETRSFEHQWGKASFAKLQSHRLRDNELAQITAEGPAKLVMGEGPHKLRVTMAKTGGDGRYASLRCQPDTLPTHGSYAITLAPGELTRGMQELKPAARK